MRVFEKRGKVMMKIKNRGKFVIIENFLFEGWLAIEGDENDKLIV